jgi:hypothetical protein
MATLKRVIWGACRLHGYLLSDRFPAFRRVAQEACDRNGRMSYTAVFPMNL